MSKKLTQVVTDASESVNTANWAIEQIEAGLDLNPEWVRDLLIWLVADQKNAGGKSIDAILEKMVAAGSIDEAQAAAIQETEMGMNSPKARLEVLRWMQKHYIPAQIAYAQMEIALSDEDRMRLEEAEVYE